MVDPSPQQQGSDSNSRSDHKTYPDRSVLGGEVGLWSSNLNSVPAPQAREAVARLPQSSLALIPDCGHMPHVECPDRFLAALDGFLLK